MKSHIASIVIVCLALTYSICLPVQVNSPLWTWAVLVFAVAGLSLLYTRLNIWIKALLVFSLINCFLGTAPFLSFNAYILMVLAAYFYLFCTKIKDFTPILKVVQSLFFLNIILIANQVFGTDQLLNFGRSSVHFGTIGNSTQMVSFMIIMAPFLLMNSKLNIIPMFLIAYLARSAGAFLALGVGTLVYTIWRVKKEIYKDCHNIIGVSDELGSLL